jgi:hypothetical protein
MIITWDALSPIKFADLNNLSLDNKRNIEDSQTILSSYTITYLLEKLPVRIYRLEIGKSEFNLSAEFITLILEKNGSQ